MYLIVDQENSVNCGLSTSSSDIVSGYQPSVYKASENSKQTEGLSLKYKNI